MTDIQAWLDEARTLASQATEGPWEADGREITQPWQSGGSWQTIVGIEVDCMPYCYGGYAKGVSRDEDGEFIADARTRLPKALNALQAVLEVHTPVDEEPSKTICAACTELLTVKWPCPTVRAIQTVIEEQGA